jgi:NAD-dependent deacetylase
MSQINPELIERAAEWIAEAGRVVVFSGAGVSAESEIPTFRDAQTGMWSKYDPMKLATVNGFLNDPVLVWEWYAYRRKLVREKEPNPGHTAVAAMEDLTGELTVVTQNVDSLHRRAGSSRVIELHGNITRVKCFSGKHIYDDWNDDEVDGDIPPLCRHCGEMLRPDVVWFGEQLPADALSESFHLADSCDVFMVVGTSGNVQPAASLPVSARQAGARVIEVNIEPSLITPSAHFLLRGKSGEVLPKVLEAMSGDK